MLDLFERFAAQVADLDHLVLCFRDEVLDGVDVCALEAVEAADGEVQLTDLGSSYGTFVGSGQRLNANSPMTLHRGDTFWLGSKEQMFRITGKGGK